MIAVYIPENASYASYLNPVVCALASYWPSRAFYSELNKLNLSFILVFACNIKVYALSFNLVRISIT